MNKNRAPLLPQLEELWREKGWSLTSLHGQFRMEEDAAAAAAAKAASDKAAADAAAAAAAKAAEDAQNEPEFPANTPVAEMTDKEAKAYWKAQARKHEARSKERADYDDVKKKADQYDNLSAASKTENERAVETARQEADDAARKDERAKTALLLVDAKVESIATARGVKPEQLEPLLEALDRTKFLTDTGEVDADKVTNFVASIAPAVEEFGKGKNGRVPDLGQGRRGSDSGAKPSTVSAGRDRYADKHKSRTQQQASS